MGELVRLSWPLHAQHMCQRLWHLLREDFSTDFELSIKDNEEDCVDQPSIRVHRLIISAVCPLFKQYMGDKILFSNRPHVDFQEVNNLVEFIYRGKTTVPQDRLPHLRHVANSLGLTVLVEIIDGLLGSSAERDATATATKETPPHSSASNSMVTDLGDVSKEDHGVSENAANKKQSYSSRHEKCSVDVSMNSSVTSDERRKKDFWCQPCSRGFEQKKDLVRHLASIHHVDRQGNKLEKNVKCPKCAFTCYAMFQLGKHRRAKHRDRSTLLKCDKCHFLCSNDDLLSRHLEMFHAHDGIFKCFKCEHVSQTPAEHVEHVRQHADNPDLDEAVSNNESELIQMEVINLSKDSKCDDIKTEEHSISETIPKQSQQTTSKTKNYNRTESKRLYVSIKRKSGKYVCQHCPRWSNNHQDLVRHLAAVHHIDKEGNKLEKAIKCSDCSYTCYAMFQLTKHHRQKHTCSHMFKCDKCDFVFGSDAQLSHHLETFHAHNGYLNYDHVSDIQHVHQHNDNRSDCDLEEMVSNDESSFGHETVMVLADDSNFDEEPEED